MPDRERFFREAACEINEAVQEFRRVLCKLIEKAWEEGKRNAETEAVTAIVESAMKDVCERLKAQEAEDFEDDPPERRDVIKAGR